MSEEQEVISVSEYVADYEQLARIIFSPSMVLGEVVAPSAFNLVRLKSGTDEDYVSVNRMDYWEPSYENCRKYRPRIEGDRIAGYAKLTAGDVRQSSIEDITTEVTAYPSKSNPFHAGISYTAGSELIKGHCESPEFLMVTSMLASQSIFVPFEYQFS